MIYGVGLGLSSDMITLKALEIIKEADEVIVPGKLAYEIVKKYIEPRIVEFPMGNKQVIKDLAYELAKRDEKIAFCCLGDPTLYSTFSHLFNEILKLNPKARIEIIPGISSISAALARLKVFVNNSMLITTQDFQPVDVAIVLKSKKPREIEGKLRKDGFSNFTLLERMHMDGERILKEMPIEADYFSLIVARK